MSNRILVVIVNYRSARLAIDCLHSLSSEVDVIGGIRVVVVDNNSSDGSFDKIADAIEKEGWSDWAKIISLAYNGGFSFGNNAGICAALSKEEAIDYVYLLNPDTIVRSCAIQALLAFMDKFPEVGVAGSRLENTDGSIEASAHNFPTPLGELVSSARLRVLNQVFSNYLVTPPVRCIPHKCHWVSGASMIIRRQLIEDIGFLDEGYFLYFEEVDFCRRAINAGWQIWYVPQSQVMHIEGATTGISKGAVRRAGYWYDSRRRYFVKYFGVSGLIFADVLWVLGRIVYLLRHCLTPNGRDGQREPKWFMFDLLWGDIKAIFSGDVCRVSVAQENKVI